MKILYTRALASFLLLFAFADQLRAQTSIPLDAPVKEDFNSIAAGLTLPANWKVSAAGQGATTTWATGLTSLTQAANSGSPASGGSYNWGTTPGTDRAVGFLSSAGYASPNAVMAHFKNTTGATVTTLTVSFSVERYRINTSGFSLGFSSSEDGAAWTDRSAGSIAAGIFAAGADGYTFDTPATINKTVTLSGLSIANNADIYFRWVFTDGVAANSQGLGLDDVSVFAGTPTAVVSSELRYILKTDNPPIDQVNPGDELTYRTSIKNSGTGDAANVVLTEPAPTNTTFVGGSVKTSTMARDETFITPFNTPLSGGNVLSNDYGIPAPTVLSFGPTADKGATAAGNSGSSDNGGVVALNADGTFTYTAPANFSGNDHFGYIAGNGNLPNNDAIVTISVGGRPVATVDSYNVVGNVSISPNSASGFLSNDTGGGLIVTAVNGSAANIGAAVVTGAGGNLTANSDGSFTYNPSPGFTGSDSFTYTIDNGFSSPSSTTVTLNVAGVVWFVNNNAGSNGDGRLSNPFKLITDVAGTAAGQSIFLYESATAYSGSVNLLATQKLIGQDASESLQTITGLTPNASYSAQFPAMNSGNGTTVLLTATNANIITLNSGNTVRGMIVGNAGTGKKITGNSFGTLTLGNATTPDLILNGTGQALDLQTGTLTGGLTSLATTSSAAQGVLINSVAGTYNFGPTSVSGSTTQGILISGSSSIVPTFGTTTVGAGTDGVSIQNNTGNVTFSSLGVTTANGIGVLGTNNSGQIIVTNNTSGINATGGAAISLSQASGTSTVNLNFSGLTSAGGTNGVNLNNIAGTIAGGSGSLTGSGTAFNVNGGSVSVTYSGTLTHSAATFYLADIKNTTGGSIALSGNLTASGSSLGIRINDTNDGTVTFSGANKSLTTGANAAVSMAFNGTSNIIFSGGGLVINTTSGTGLNVTGGAGSLEVTGAGNTITTTSGTCMNIANTNASANGITFVSLTTSTGRLANINGSTGTKTMGRVQQTDANGSGTGSALSLESAATVNIGDASVSTIKTTTGTGIRIVDGTTLNISGAGLDVTTTTGRGIDIAGSTIAAGAAGLRVVTAGGTGVHALASGTATITGSVNTVNTPGGIALNVSSGTANFTFQNVSASGGTSNAIAYNVAAGTTTIGVGTITGNASAATFLVNGGTASITYGGSMTQSNNAELLRIEGGHQTGTIAFNTGTLSASNGTGLQFDNADGIYNFNGTTTLSGSGDEGIDILNGSAGTFTFGDNTSITSPSGVSFNVNGGTASVTYSGNITHATNTAMVNIAGGHTTGTITFQTGTLNASNGTGLQFDNADGTYNFNGTTTLNGGDAGIDLLNGTSGTFTFGTNTAITNPSGTAFNLSGATASNATVTYSGSITDNTGFAVDIDNHDANTITFQTGSITSTANGIRVQNSGGGDVNFNNPSKSLTTAANAAVSLASNTGSAINFGTSGLVISTTSGIGFNATGGGTVSVTGTGNTIVSTTGTALNVNATTIGAGGLTFLSINVNGASKGISLNNTGSGGLTVTGTGTTDGSGGTIQNITTRGAEFISASNISLKNMNFTNACTADFPAAPTGLSLGNNTADNAVIHFQTVTNASLDNLNLTGSAEQGINGNTVTNFTLANSALLNCGNGPDEDGLHFYNMLGTNNITSTTVTSSGDDNVNIQNASGVSTINVTGGSFNTGVLGSGLLFGPRVAANTTINISGVTCNNNFSGGVVADCSNGASMDVEVSTSTITNNNDAIQVSGASGNVKFDIHDNSNLSGQDFVNITILKAAFSVGGTLEGKIRNNSITTENGHTADGITVFNAGGGTLKIAITGNTMNYAGTQRAILLQGGQDGASALEATVTGNSIAIQLDGVGNAVAGILAQSQVTDPEGAGSTLCIDMGGAGALSNTFTHPLGGTMAAGDMRVRQRFTGNVRLPGYAGAGNDTAAVAAFLDSRNSEVSPSTASLQDGSYSGGAACAQPSF